MVVCRMLPAHLRSEKEKCNVCCIHGCNDAEVERLRPEVAQQKGPQLGQRRKQVRLEAIRALQSGSA